MSAKVSISHVDLGRIVARITQGDRQMENEGSAKSRPETFSATRALEDQLGHLQGQGSAFELHVVGNPK